MERPESFIVPARRSQWLVSAMAYAFGLDQGIENEIVVLATGIDQYIQEIFHNLDVLGKDRVSLEDFRILCEVIGFRDCGKSPTDETVPDCEEDPLTELTFKEFHSRLLQCFIEDDGSDCRSQDCQKKALRRWDSSGKFVEAEVRVLPRSGLSIRTMCTECFQKRPVTEIYHSVMFKQGKFHCIESSTNETDTARQNDLNSAGSSCSCGNQIRDTHNEMGKLQQENDGLREIVEDMRQALQSSDARHLALLVALRKLELGASGGNTSNQQRFPPLQPKLPGHSSIRPQNAVTLARELSRLRDDRDRQLEEAICYTQSLEADLWRSRRDQNRMNQTRSVLLNNQQSLAQHLCSARETLSGGLERVRELGRQMEDVEKLQSDLQKFSEWKLRKRDGSVIEEVAVEARGTSATSEVVTTENHGRTSEDTMALKSDLEGSERSSDASGGSSDASGGSSEDFGGSSEDSGGDHLTGMDSGCASDSDRGSPLSAGSEADSSSLGSGSISDEESAWQEEANNNNNNTNSNNNNNRCANSALTGGLNDVDWLIKLTQVQKHLLKTEVEKGQAEGKFKQIRADLLQELNAKLKENEEYQSEIQKLESERVRLSVIESTVGEVITLLRRLRNVNLSRRSAGKILMDTLEVCLQDNYNSDSENEVRNFLNFFHKQLMHHDLLRLCGAGTRGTQSTPCSPVMRRSTPTTTTANAAASASATASPAQSVQLNTDFYQFHGGSAAKKLCRGRGAAAATDTANDDDMTSNGNSRTLDVSA